MEHRCQELTLGDALADPLVRTVMAADGVDPDELSDLLSGIVATIDHAQLQPSRGAFSVCNELRPNTFTP